MFQYLTTKLKKMKSYHLISFILFALISQKIIGQTKNSDTIFIKKDHLYGYKQSIFIEKNKNSEFYNNITNFEFNDFDKESYQTSLDYLKKNKISLNKQKNILPSDKWIAIKYYNNEFYAYHPCDFYSFYQISITDSVYIELTGEGPIANKILNKKKVNNNTFELKATSIYEENKTIKIHILDYNKEIAIFENIKEDGSSYYYLMISANKIKSIPFIVNHCEIHKQSELEFEQPDFKELIKMID